MLRPALRKPERTVCQHIRNGASHHLPRLLGAEITGGKVFLLPDLDGYIGCAGKTSAADALPIHHRGGLGLQCLASLAVYQPADQVI